MFNKLALRDINNPKWIISICCIILKNNNLRITCIIKRTVLRTK